MATAQSRIGARASDSDSKRVVVRVAVRVTIRARETRGDPEKARGGRARIGWSDETASGAKRVSDERSGRRAMVKRARFWRCGQHVRLSLSGRLSRSGRSCQFWGLRDTERLGRPYWVRHFGQFIPIRPFR